MTVWNFLAILGMIGFVVIIWLIVRIYERKVLSNQNKNNK